LTPDLSVATDDPNPRDLLVVEAKDRYRMSAGTHRFPSRKAKVSTAPKPRTALDVGERYVVGLKPIVTWVCNHCDFRENDVTASVNYGGAWSHLYLASGFRPGSVPEDFDRSVAMALTPPGLQIERTERSINELVLVVDITSSMEGKADGVWSVLADSSMTDRISSFRAILYADHEETSPFLIRDIGPFDHVREIMDAIGREPSGGGGDVEEALEDAVKVCADLAAEYGPLLFLVLTDAPPHTLGECPMGVDFASEVERMLGSGSYCYVVDDWQDRRDRTWAEFEGRERFQRGPLDELGGFLALPMAESER
jgi:hypothetical protein